MHGRRYGELKTGGGMELSQRQIYDGLRIAGEADVVRQLEGLSGISAGSDFSSGIYIDGNLPAHVLYRIDGVPVFYPYRFGGIFSTFNAGHFASVDFERSIHDASMPSRVGSKLDFRTFSSMPRQFEGAANVGLLSSSFSFRVPVASRLSIAASARVSYIDLLYGHFLQGEDTRIKYGFYDFNLTARYQATEHDEISINAFYSHDGLNYKDVHYVSDTGFNWNNGLVSALWQHRGRLNMTHRIYLTSFDNRLGLNLPQFRIGMPSALRMYGAAGKIDAGELSRRVTLSGGYELNGYVDKLLSLTVSDLNREDRGAKIVERPFEARLYADARFVLSNAVRLDAGLSATAYTNGRRYFRFVADPRLTLHIGAGPGDISLHFGKYSQFLHQVGFSDLGLANDFRVMAGRDTPRETSLNIAADYTAFLHGGDYSVSGGVYGKRILNQLEYLGDILSILDDDYTAQTYIEAACGYAWGVNLQARKGAGRLKGQIGISYGMARVKFENTDTYTLARSDQGFSASAAASYEFNSHWHAGGRFKYASGRPYTPIAAIYMIAGNVMREYGKPNSRRLPPWHSLDLSGGWKTVSKAGRHTLTHSIDLSIINVYGRKNPEFKRYSVDIVHGTVKTKLVYSIYRFLPSISYTIQF